MFFLSKHFRISCDHKHRVWNYFCVYFATLLGNCHFYPSYCLCSMIKFVFIFIYLTTLMMKYYIIKDKIGKKIDLPDLPYVEILLGNRFLKRLWKRQYFHWDYNIRNRKPDKAVSVIILLKRCHLKREIVWFSRKVLFVTARVLKHLFISHRLQNHLPPIGHDWGIFEEFAGVHWIMLYCFQLLSFTFTDTYLDCL